MNCPLTGKICLFEKVISVTEILSKEHVISCQLCEDCGKQMINLNTKPKTELILPSGPCPRCQLTISDLYALGRFGCQDCYNHFTEEVKIICGKHQAGANKHLGKRPKKDKVERLKTLKLRLAKAVELENYEEAGKLKKEIDQLI